MKTVTETKYQTSDGRTFSNEGKARCHEIEQTAKSFLPNGDDGEPVKLTTVKLLEAMASHPGAFMEVLAPWTSDGRAEAAE